MGETYKQKADRVLGMLQHAEGNDPSNGHLTMNNWEWPTGVALYGIYKTWQESGDRAILDYLTGWYDVEDILKLEVEKRNAENSKKEVVIDWLYDVITTTVEPAMLAEETDYIKQVVEFMRANHEAEPVKE